MSRQSALESFQELQKIEYFLTQKGNLNGKTPLLQAYHMRRPFAQSVQPNFLRKIYQSVIWWCCLGSVKGKADLLLFLPLLLWIKSLFFFNQTIYRIYPKYSDTSTPYHICSKIWTSTIHYPMLCLKIAGWVANSVDPDETPRSAVSHLGLYRLLRPVCPNTYGKYGKYKPCLTWKIFFL